MPSILSFSLKISKTICSVKNSYTWKLSTGATRWLRNTFGILINFQLEKPDGFGNCLGILSEFYKTFLEFFNNSTAICFSLNLPLDLEAVNWYGGFHLGIEFLSGSVYLMSQALKNKIAFNSFLLSQNCSILKRRQKQASCAADTVSSLPFVNWRTVHWTLGSGILSLFKNNLQFNLFLVL